MKITGIGGSAPKAIKMLCLCAALAAGMAANGQMYSYAYAEDATYSSSAIYGLIRGHSPTTAVALYTDSVSQCFTFLVDGIATHNTVGVPDYLTIGDFQVIGDTVYFSGKLKQLEHALLGYFDLNDLMAPAGGLVTFHYADMYGPYSLATLPKLAVKSVNGTVKVMAIGHTEGDDVTLPMNRVLYHPDIHGSPNYEVAELDAEERIMEVLVTDDYFAVVGFPKLLTSTLSVRALSVLENQLQGTTFFTRHEYITPNACDNWITATALDGNNIAVSSMYKSLNDPNSQAETQVYTINLPSGNMTHFQSFRIPLKANPQDMVYLPGCQRLVLTEPLYYENGNHITGFIYLDPYPVAHYIAQEHCQDNQIEIYSLSRLTGSHLLGANLSRWFYLDYPQLNTSQCYSIYKRDVKVGTPIEKTSNDVLSPINDLSDFNSDDRASFISTLQNPCLEIKRSN